MNARPARVALVTGAASGIGQATAQALRSRGDRVIGVDLRDVDIVADLSNADGRAGMIEQAGRLAPDGLDLIVAAAGIAGGPPGRTVAVNYFGALATLDGLRPLLARRAPAHAIAICSTAAMHSVDADLLAACAAGDEPRAITAADGIGNDEYATSKRALLYWVRRAAVRPEWGGARLYLNAISPGFTLTGMTRPMLDDPAIAAQIDASTPRAVDHVGTPEDLAEAILAIADLRGGYVLGQVLHVDGGTDAIRRPEIFLKGGVA